MGENSNRKLRQPDTVYLAVWLQSYVNLELRLLHIALRLHPVMGAV